MKVLVTGFQPFGKDTVNPALEAVRLLPEEIGGAVVVKQELPVVFGKAGQLLENRIAQEQPVPDIVLCVGQAGGRACISVERVAINLAESPGCPDNEGNCPGGEPICPEGENAYFATVPVKAMVRAMQDRGIPAALSYSAGTYVCNDLMYRLLYLLDKKYPHIRGGFIHVPFDTAQGVGRPANTPTMPVSVVAQGLQYGIEAAIQGKELFVPCGSTH